MGVIHDEEDGKEIDINFAPGSRDEVIIQMKDGSEHKMPSTLARMLAFVIVGMTEHLVQKPKQRRKGTRR